MVLEFSGRGGRDKSPGCPLQLFFEVLTGLRHLPGLVCLPNHVSRSLADPCLPVCLLSPQPARGPHPSWWLSETLEDPAAILWPLSLLCSQLGSAAGCGGSSDRCLSNLPPPVPLAPLACQFPKAELGGGELKKECSGSVGSRPDGPVIQPAAPKPSQWICGGGRKGILNRYRINMLVDKALGSKTCVLAFLNQSPTYKVF